ncbi:MAG: hypothetical protein GEU77_14465 [Deltaproteobacteria bacterium]|nr:hypothetical protein [Deltaproteobacteria bacterium]
MTYDVEFETVELLENSDAETRGVDAFALSLIKAERQIRKLFTYLVFQFPAFSLADVAGFRDVLGQNKKVYFDGFINGIDALCPKSVKDLVGGDYDSLVTELHRAIDFRNKIFHGQLTDKFLSREELLALTTTIRKWCQRLAMQAESEFDYNGFARNSLRKHSEPIWTMYRIHIANGDDYRKFIRKHMEAHRKRPCTKG